MHWANLDRLRPQDEVKFVIADRADYEWSRALVRERALGGRARRPLLARARRARARRAGALGPRGRAARARPGPAAQVPLAGRGARRLSAPRPLAVVCVSGGMDSAVTAATAARGPRARVPARELRPAHGGQGAGLLPRPGRPLRGAPAPGRGFPRACRHRREQPHRPRHPRPRRRAARRASSRPRTCRSATRTSWPPPPPGARCSAPARSSSARSGRTPPAIRTAGPDFYRAFEEAIRQGTRPETEIRIETPVIRTDQGRHRAARDGRSGCRSRRPGPATRRRTVACGVCESCRLRLRGFAEAGVGPTPIARYLASREARENTGWTVCEGAGPRRTNP